MVPGGSPDAATVSGRRPKFHPIWLLAALGFGLGVGAPLLMDLSLAPAPPGSKAQAVAPVRPVVSAEALLRDAPKANAKILARAVTGAKLVVTGTRGAWARVRLGNERQAWVLASELGKPLDVD